MQIRGEADKKAWIVVSIRPYNPEGVSFINEIEALAGKNGWDINKKNKIYLSEPWDAHKVSSYKEGDVYTQLFLDRAPAEKISCQVGLATAAGLYELAPGKVREISAYLPLKESVHTEIPRAFENVSAEIAERWDEKLQSASRLSVPDKHCSFLYESALRSMVLHSPGEIYPGPYTYKHFWFRDAVMIGYALLCAGFVSRTEKVMEHFWKRQSVGGYFHSQEGEWDSNGQVLWLMHKFCLMTGTEPKPEWKGAIKRGADWIVGKRLSEDPASPHSGLFPAGFSAEHLGPNDYYYWTISGEFRGFVPPPGSLKDWARKTRPRNLRAKPPTFHARLKTALRSPRRGSARRPCPLLLTGAWTQAPSARSRPGIL